jgi:hypothetical protein
MRRIALVVLLAGVATAQMSVLMAKGRTGLPAREDEKSRHG